MEARARGRRRSDASTVQPGTPPPTSAKQIVVKPIARADANRIIKALHYSGKVVNNSQIHLGVFLNGKCGGAMQYGPSMVKRGMLHLVEGTKWNGFLELNRMAFADWLPRNSESRAIGYSLRWLRKEYPHIEWVVSFADGTQCGDGAIYRASGFVLTNIKRNDGLRKHPVTGKVTARMTAYHHGYSDGEWRSWDPLPGFQFRYMYFLNPEARERLTVPIIPFSEIKKRGGSMYRGERSVGGVDSDTPDVQSGEGGAIPTPTLHAPSRNAK